MIDKIAKEVFPDFEKWDAFIELGNHKAALFDYWITGYRKTLREIFSEKYKYWRVDFEYKLNLFFYPADYEHRKSMEIWIEDGFCLSFWLNINLFDIGKAKGLIKEMLPLIEKETNQIISFNSDPNNSYAFKIQLHYDLPNYMNSDSERLIYFADKELPDAIVKVIHPLLSNPKILQLFKDVNNQCIKAN